MPKIVAIGGGEIGRPGFPVETTLIDKEIIRLSAKRNPQLLFIPTASSDSQLYVDTVVEHFGKRLGCKVKILKLYSPLTQNEIKRMVDDADIIYVGGGNTLKMMNRWRKLGVDKMLLEASDTKVLAGLSAGAICWFASGLSDSRAFSSKGEQWSYIQVTGLKLYGLSLCPHYSDEPKRQKVLEHSLRSNSGIAIALDNCVALEIVNDTFRIIKSSSAGKAYKVFWQRGVLHKEEIKDSKDFLPLGNLLVKV